MNNATLDVFNQPRSADVPNGIRFSSEGSVHVGVIAKSDFSALTQDTRGYVTIPTGCFADFDLRISLYEGDYTGPYKPYSGSQLYASQAELKIANDNISSKVSTKDYTGTTVASLINQSADSVKIQAKHVEIDGTTKFTNGTNVTTVGDYVGGIADDAVKSLEIGGTNLLA